MALGNRYEKPARQTGIFQQPARRKALNGIIKTLTIQQVSQRTGLTTHTLRFWENELKGILVPLRTKGHQRRYTVENLYVIEEIKRLKTAGLSLDDVKIQLNNRLNCEKTVDTNQNKVDLLANRVAEVVRSVVQSFFENEKVPEVQAASHGTKK